VQDFGQQLSLAVAEVLDRERRARGLSLDALATASGMHRTSVGLAVRGRRGLTLTSAAGLARAMDLSLSEVVREAEAAVTADPSQRS